MDYHSTTLTQTRRLLTFPPLRHKGPVHKKGGIT